MTPVQASTNVLTLSREEIFSVPAFFVGKGVKKDYLLLIFIRFSNEFSVAI